MLERIQVVRYSKVISIDDDTDADRIKVRLIPEDNSKTIDEIDYAFPLLPKIFHVKPKVGEAVFIFLATTNDGNSQRYYLGPIISQDHRIYNEPIMGAESFMRGAYKNFDIAPRMDPEQKGILPKDDDIIIRGRKNVDIQLTDDDVRIKAGVKIVDENNKYKMVFNRRNPSYAKFKYHTKPLDDGSQSTAAVVAEKIAFISTSSPYLYEVTDRDNLITDAEMNKIIESAYKLPYGEKLVQFLKIFVEAFLKHTHNFPMLPPNPATTESLEGAKMEMLDREKMLSNTVRIN